MSTTTEVSFTLQDVVDKVREVAAERPDFVYEAPEHNEFGDPICKYRQDGKPSCIVGQALDRLGYVVPEVEENTSADEVVGSLFGFGYLNAPKEARWLRFVQTYQDLQNPWSKAVEFADAEVKL